MTERRKLILVVDDEASNRELLEALLTGMGHDVDTAADGAEALAKLTASHDLVLLDVMMPGIDGFETARRIRAGSCAPQIPICMATALTGKEERLAAVEAGANDFISKPIDKVELRVRTTSLLKAKEAADDVRRFGEALASQNLLLEQNYEKLSQLSTMKDEFISMASHDLKNPLTCILGFASIIEARTPPGELMTEEAHTWIAKITEHCQVMQRIIEDFLEFQALEDGQIKLTLEVVDLNALAAEVMNRNAAYAAKKRIVLSLDLCEDTITVNADRRRLNQVLDNLVGNALKFGAPGDGAVIAVRAHAGMARVEVCDSGPGLLAGDMAKLFVKYARLGNAPTGGEKSSGLGLAICKRVIEMHQGTIGARNNAGEGSTFWFVLPEFTMARPAP